MKEFLDGFISAAKETPRGFFAPLIAIWRLFSGVTDSVLKKAITKFHHYRCTLNQIAILESQYAG
jgi:hypothetical protein